MEHETFWTLLTNSAHWEFELFLMFLFDIVIGVLIWPHLRDFLRHHKGDDDQIACLKRQVALLMQRTGTVDKGCEHESCNDRPT